MSEEKKNIENFFDKFLKGNDLSKLLMNMGSSYIINCDTLSKIVNSKADLTDELISKEINSFKKLHPSSTNIINKYLKSYEEKHSDKTIYQIRKFLQSGDCRTALEDSEVKKYLNEVLNSPRFEENFRKLFNNLNKQSS